MTIGALRAAGVKLLQQHGVESPELDASLLLAHLFHKDRTWLILNKQNLCESHLIEIYYGMLEQRVSGDSVAYITGLKEFMGLTFSVNKNVLVPRPDTELLVEKAMEWIDNQPKHRNTALKVLDACTGSGCIGISIKYYKPETEMVLSDISTEALEVARINVAHLLTKDSFNTVHCIESNLLRYFIQHNQTFDLIVSNPPYIPSMRIPFLSKEVRQEPLLALDGGPDGLDLIRTLIDQATQILSNQGTIFLESEPEQIRFIQELLKNHGFHEIESYPDLSGTLRCTKGSKMSL